MSDVPLNPNGHGSTPVPDPTRLTTEAVDRAVLQWQHQLASLREIIETRLDAADVAVVLRLAATDRQAINLREYMDERLASVALQFRERDTRSERESRDNALAVGAAFAAQEKQAAAQNKSNAEAIGKSELATTETIKTNQELTRTANEAMRGQLDDLKERIAKVESVRLAAAEGRTEQRAGQSAGVGVLMAVLGTITVLISVGALVASIAARQ